MAILASIVSCVRVRMFFWLRVFWAGVFSVATGCGVCTRGLVLRLDLEGCGSGLVGLVGWSGDSSS